MLNPILTNNENLLPLNISNLQILKISMNSQSQIGRQSPRSRRPSQQLHLRLIFDRKTNINRWITNFLIILLYLKIR